MPCCRQCAMSYDNAWNGDHLMGLVLDGLWHGYTRDSLNIISRLHGKVQCQTRR